VTPVLTYAAETWTTTKNDDRRLEYLRKENPSLDIWSSEEGWEDSGGRDTTENQ
jgi:hypothetical protein